MSKEYCYIKDNEGKGVKCELLELRIKDIKLKLPDGNIVWKKSYEVWLEKIGV